MRVFSVLGGGLLWACSANAWAGQCQEPTTSAQTVDTKALEGQVQATVMSIGGSVGGSQSRDQQWEAQLASQEAIDNQWYLYYLCKEYEAHRINRSQYCTLANALWTRIIGQPVTMGDCATGGGAAQAPAPQPQAETAILPGSTPEPLAAVVLEPEKTPEPPPVVVITEVVSEPAPAPAPAPVQEAPSQQEVRRGRWAALHSSGMAVDVFGPVRLAGEEVWYVENEHCLSIMQHDPAQQQWIESIWTGDCAPWEDISIEAKPSTLLLKEASSQLEFDFIEPASSELSDGLYTGDLGVIRNVSSNTPLLDLMLGPSPPKRYTQSIVLSLSERRGTLTWGETGCEGVLGSPRVGAGWIQFTERLQSGQDICIDGGKVTVMTLSSDAVLVLWSSENALGRGVLRRER